jgi:hypothetical protein
VEIRGDSVGNGFAIEIEDRGLGMPETEIAAHNERLAVPPEFDLANSDQLGLFVAATLAARHQIKISLRPSPYGGTTAIVLLPPTIVVVPAQDADQAPEPASALTGRRLQPGSAPEPGALRRPRSEPSPRESAMPAASGWFSPGPARSEDVASDAGFSDAKGRPARG